MSQALRCAFCREELQGQAVVWQGQAFCCQACAFEASKRLGSICGGGETTEISRRFSSKGSSEA